MQVHEQLLKTDVQLKTDVETQMSRYVDIKKLKLKDKDKEIFVMRLAQVRALTKKYIWKCVEKEVIERGFENTPDNRQEIYKKFRMCIPTHSMQSQKWKDFYDGCCEITSAFQIYGTAADEIEVQSPQSLSALMHVHEQLLRTSIDTVDEKYFGTSLKSAASSYTMIGKLRIEEIENVTKHSIDQRGAAGSEAGSGDNENDVDSGPNSFRKKIIDFIRRERKKEEGGDGRDRDEGDDRDREEGDGRDRDEGDDRDRDKRDEEGDERA